jgi:hypothetical protein
MEQNKDYLVATETLSDLLKQQQQMNDNEEQLSKVCFVFVLIFTDIELMGGAVTLIKEKID